MPLILFSLFFFPIALSANDLELRVPPDFPVQINARAAEPVLLKGGVAAQMNILEVTNTSPASIIAFVFKSACAPESRGLLEAATGVTEHYFYAQSSREPISAGDTRALYVVPHRKTADKSSRCAFVPISILFDDGTSWGAREPYAEKYLSTLEAWMVDHQGRDGRSLNPEEHELFHQVADTVLAIRAETHRLEMERLKGSVTPR